MPEIGAAAEELTVKDWLPDDLLKIIFEVALLFLFIVLVPDIDKLPAIFRVEEAALLAVLKFKEPDPDKLTLPETFTIDVLEPLAPPPIKDNAPP